MVTKAVAMVTKTYLDLLVHVTLWSSELSWIFNLDQDNKVKVVPQVVFHPKVLFKRNCLVIKCSSFQTENRRVTLRSWDMGLTEGNIMDQVFITIE